MAALKHPRVPQLRRVTQGVGLDEENERVLAQCAANTYEQLPEGSEQEAQMRKSE